MIQLFLFVKKLFNGQKKRFFGLKINFLMNKKDKKIEKVMGEFKDKSLKSSSGKKVTDRNQAMAIAFSEAKKLKHGGRIKSAKCRDGLAQKGKTRGVLT